MSRAAFAVMIKYSGYLNIFEEMHLEVDAEMMTTDQKEKSNETDIKIAEVISKVSQFD